MALNTTSGLQIDGWRRKMQPYLMKTLVATEISDTTIKQDLDEGDTVHYPYFSSASAVSYTPGSDITLQSFSSTDETLTVDQKYVVPNQLDEIETLQSNYKVRAEMRERSAYKLRDEIDKDVLGHYSDATTTVDEGDIGGTAGSAITATTGNTLRIFSAARRELGKLNVPDEGDFFAVITHDLAELVNRTAVEKGFNLADKNFKNQYAGQVNGFDVYVSNNVQSATYDGKSCDRVLLGKKGGISLAVQQTPSVKVVDKEKQLGVNIFVYAVWGTNVFTKHADYLVDAPIASYS
jgi:hypothetical protein